MAHVSWVAADPFTAPDPLGRRCGERPCAAGAGPPCPMGPGMAATAGPEARHVPPAAEAVACEGCASAAPIPQVYSAEGGEFFCVERDGAIIATAAYIIGTQVTEFKSGAEETSDNVAALRRVCVDPDCLGDEVLGV